jgi:hypothetical protein
LAGAAELFVPQAASSPLHVIQQAKHIPVDPSNPSIPGPRLVAAPPIHPSSQDLSYISEAKNSVIFAVLGERCVLLVILVQIQGTNKKVGSIYRRKITLSASLLSLL